MCSLTRMMRMSKNFFHYFFGIASANIQKICHISKFFLRLPENPDLYFSLFRLGKRAARLETARRTQ